MTININKLQIIDQFTILKYYDDSVIQIWRDDRYS